MSNNSGFTLLELLVVIAIFATLAGLVVFGSQDMVKGYQLRSAARAVYSDMQSARMKAIKEGTETQISFDVADAAYTLNFGGTSREVDLGNLYPGLVLCNPQDSSFKPNGTTGVPGPSIRLSFDGDGKKVYVSSTGTGNIRIIDESTCP